jgi:hypothetical protein
MSRYLITARTATSTTTYTAIGQLGALLDAAYDSGALGVSAMALAPAQALP